MNSFFYVCANGIGNLRNSNQMIVFRQLRLQSDKIKKCVFQRKLRNPPHFSAVCRNMYSLAARHSKRNSDCLFVRQWVFFLTLCELQAPRPCVASDILVNKDSGNCLLPLAPSYHMNQSWHSSNDIFVRISDYFNQYVVNCKFGIAPRSFRYERELMHKQTHRPKNKKRVHMRDSWVTRVLYIYYCCLWAGLYFPWKFIQDQLFMM